MSLAGAMNSAISGLSAQTSALATVSSNLANSSTTAYKTSTTSFASLVAGSGSTKSGGVTASNISNVTSQGLLVASTTTTNLAIEGDGFFIVSTEGDSSSRYYTRNGEFSVDEEGYLTNGESYLLGWETDDDGNVSGGASSVNLTKIDVSSVQSSAAATTEVDTNATLPADAAVGDAFESSFEVYDSLGTASTVTATYTKTGTNAWTVSYASPLSADTSSTIGTVTSASDVDLTFDTDGNLLSTTPASATLAITGWTTGAADSSISLGFDDLTQNSSNDSASAEIVVDTISADGRAYGTLSGVEIDTDGSVIASFSNGESRAIYKIPVATFTNADGLIEGNSGLYSVSTNSGNATLHIAGTGGAGVLQSSQLESSNVDTSTEFSSMLAAQQAYSSASQIISTSKEMFDSLISAVR
ncbi:flagellar hook protein FlgE [Cohaesibacter celericrescens]|uniref:Flagellar hook protein FlgE n=1 Tax=Cohaesibacter celericrescens TaxID=2067669 RepID=A0A2N5XPI9_9HYPH|nr:flagellar hook protein FlgE [Cohaesibacter celericrescens]PLW76451.1 flagellar hook protein FlgE [Cohaesibacter celericrescens]